MTTASDLNLIAEFDLAFRVDEEGNVTCADGIYSPDVYVVTDEEGQIIGDAHISGEGWTFVNGYSGQDSYAGPIMHPSEFLGGKMAQDVLDSPGVYVVVGVIDPDDTEDLIGWVLLERKGN